MKKSLFILLLGTFVSANVEVKSLDIYANKTFVNQIINSNEKSVNLLSNINFTDLKIKLPKACILNSSNLNRLPFENDSLSKEIEKKEEEISKIQNEIKALKSNIAYLEKASLTSILDIKNLIETSKFLKSEIKNDSNKIYTLEKDKTSKQEELKVLLEKRKDSIYTKLNYDISCSKKQKIVVTYPLVNLSKRNSYDINFSSKENTLDIKYNSFLKQQSGFEFKNIDVNLYTYDYLNRLRPSIFKPEFLHNEVEEKLYSDVAVSKRSMMPIMQKAVNSESISYNEFRTKAFYQAKNVTLKSGVEKQITFLNDKYEASSKIEIDGFDSASAFLKVSFLTNKVYLAQNAKFYIDDVYVGQHFQREMKKDKQNNIYLSTSSFIDVKKEFVKDFEEDKFFSINDKKTIKTWEYTITNNSKVKENISLIEKVPVSKHEDIKVTILSEPKYTKLDKSGKVSYDFELLPKESKKIKFSYEIQRPKK